MTPKTKLPWSAGRVPPKTRAHAPKVVCVDGRCTWTRAVSKPGRPTK